MVTRRDLMREAGVALVGLAAAPAIGTFNLLAPLRNSFEGSHIAYDPFSADASTADISLSEAAFAGSLRMQEAYFALMDIYDRLGLRKQWAYRLDYLNAAQCKSEYERKEAEWRSNNYNLFLSIQRPQIDREIAYAVADKVNTNNAFELNAQGAVQYHTLPAVTLADDDAGLLLAASILLQGDGMSQQELAQSLAATSKKAVYFNESGHTDIRGTVLETPVSTVFHNPRPYIQPTTRRYHHRGRVYVRNKRRGRQIASIKYAGLYV